MDCSIKNGSDELFQKGSVKLKVIKYVLKKRKSVFNWRKMIKKGRKSDKQGWFYLGMMMVVLSGLTSMVITIIDIVLVVYGVDDTDFK